MEHDIMINLLWDAVDGYCKDGLGRDNCPDM